MLKKEKRFVQSLDSELEKLAEEMKPMHERFSKVFVGTEWDYLIGEKLLNMNRIDLSTSYLDNENNLKKFDKFADEMGAHVAGIVFVGLAVNNFFIPSYSSWWGTAAKCLLIPIVPTLVAGGRVADLIKASPRVLSLVNKVRRDRTLDNYDKPLTHGLLAKDAVKMRRDYDEEEKTHFCLSIVNQGYQTASEQFVEK